MDHNLVLDDKPALLGQATNQPDQYLRDLQAACIVLARKSPTYAAAVAFYLKEAKVVLEGL